MSNGTSSDSTAAGVARVLYRPEEVARALCLSRSKVFELMAAGELRSVKVGRLRRISADAVAEFVTTLEDR